MLKSSDKYNNFVAIEFCSRYPSSRHSFIRIRVVRTRKWNLASSFARRKPNLVSFADVSLRTDIRRPKAQVRKTGQNPERGCRFEWNNVDGKFA